MTRKDIYDADGRLLEQDDEVEPMRYMDKIKVLGKEHTPNMPDEFPVEDFEKFLENYRQYPDLEPDFFDMIEEFSAVVFIKNNKDLFVRMMVEECIRFRWIGIKNWFNRNIPI